jgi:hypothetical protein
MLLQALIGPVTSILDKFIPDADTKKKLAHEIATMAEKHTHEAAMAQIEVNKAEAVHRSIFVAGWRPFIGWTCGVALAYHFIAFPVLSFALVVFPESPVKANELPSFDMGSLMTVLMGMLGLGGLRTFEKYKGVSK